METNDIDTTWIINHPVSKIRWIEIEKIQSNDYNPNKVANPEMQLLELSILEDGYTQPVVVWEIAPDKFEVVDGFHRFLVGKKIGMTHLPCTIINNGRADRSDRIASTIRHNRARGRHQVAAMSDIVIELSKRNWTDKKIGKELGMEPDEVLRLKQIGGLVELFADEEFSEAWELIEEIK